jgi:hypothetical protein
VLTTLSSRQVEALLLEESERADRLRQLLPFVDVLTDGAAARLGLSRPTLISKLQRLGISAGRGLTKSGESATVKSSTLARRSSSVKIAWQKRRWR